MTCPGEAATAVAALDCQAERVRTPCPPGTMVWRVWGAGRPLVLLHGASGSWTHWIRNIPALAPRFQVLVPDLPGYGDSDLPREPHTADGLADIVSAGLDLVVPPPAPLELAGFSFGGIIAGLVAARQGARVRTLALLGPNGMALRVAPLPALLRVRPDMTPGEARETHRENLRRLMVANPSRADDLAVHVQMENLRRARFRSAGIPESDALLRALPAVRARIAGIWGGRDAFTGPYLEERRQTLARFQPGLDFRVIEGAGHWVIYEAATEVNAALLDVLDGGGGPR